MFCSHCGSPIDARDVFCSRCGGKLSGEQGQVQQAARQQAATPPVWVLPAQKKLSMFKSIPCSIVFMQDQVVFAYLSPERQKAENAGLEQDLKSKGTGFLKSSAAMMRYWADYHKKYYAMTPEAILAEDASNLALPNSFITHVLFECYSETASYSDDPSRATGGKLQFALASRETFPFMHTQAADKTVQAILTNLFGARLKYRK